MIIQRAGTRILTIGNPMEISAPRGAAVAWTPASISGIKLWLDFGDPDTLFTDAGSTNVSSDGDAIYQANDKSGNSDHAIQSTEGNRPTYKVNIKNGLSVALFDGGDWLQSTNSFYTGETTVFAIARWDDTGTSGDHLFGTTGSDTYGLAQARYDAFRLKNITDWSTGATIADNTFYVLTAVFSGTDSLVKVNGASDITGDSGSYNVNATRRIGSGGSSTAPLNGYIGEILFYDSYLSSDDRGLVQTYLNNKWSIY